MQLSQLASASRDIASTRSRKRKAAAASQALRAAGPSVAVAASYLCGELPQGRIGVGWALLSKTRAQPDCEHSTLTVDDVDRRLTDIAAIAGKGSQQRKQQSLGSLFAAAPRDERDFLVRLLSGELRQGALDGVMVEAIATAADVDVRSVRRALMYSGNIGNVAAAAMTRGSAGLAEFSMTLFRPVLPMLAQPADDLEAIVGDTPVALEYKMDGARIQLHKSGRDIRVFSRGLKDVTAAVPELVELGQGIAARETIVDGEVIALRSDGSPEPFQTTMRRFGRKQNVAEMRDTLPLTGFVFDCMYIDGQETIDDTLEDRMRAMSSIVEARHRIPGLVTDDAERANEFWTQALQSGHEGIMAKALQSNYDAGGRGKAWQKLKPAHSLDLVVLAAEWGSGRRSGWLSNLHLGARGPRDGEFIMLGKTFKGMTDAMLQWQTQHLLGLELSRTDWVVRVRPQLVVEIAFNEVQASPVYDGGYALRFARVKRYRQDKRAQDADTIESVTHLFRQSRRET